MRDLYGSGRRSSSSIERLSDRDARSQGDLIASCPAFCPTNLSQVIPVNSGSKTLKDAVNEAFRDWVTNLSTTHYLVGSAIGPHPFPTIVRDYQKVISKEIKEQLQAVRGKLPDALVACVGGGSNAIGTFYNFIPDRSVRLIGVEAGGEGARSPLGFPLVKLVFTVGQVWTVTNIAPRSPRVHQVCYTVLGHIFCSQSPAKSSKRTRSALVWIIQVSGRNMPG